MMDVVAIDANDLDAQKRRGPGASIFSIIPDFVSLKSRPSSIRKFRSGRPRCLMSLRRSLSHRAFPTPSFDRRFRFASGFGINSTRSLSGRRTRAFAGRWFAKIIEGVREQVRRPRRLRP